MSSRLFFKQVPRVAFGEGSFKRLPELIEMIAGAEPVVFIVDDVHKSTGLSAKIPVRGKDRVEFLSTVKEPTTDQVDGLRSKILAEGGGRTPGAIVGFGGGSTLDVAKAVSVVLTNEGSSTLYQGWDLVPKPAVPKVGIPTLSGTGAEASRTAVLTAKDKKYGINSDFSMFDCILLDPCLIQTVPNDQRFFTGMDCYIHSVESIEGSFINAFGRPYAQTALDLSRSFFLKRGATDEDLMVASYLGGASVANSEVGVCHALSYGLSLELGFHHGIANCIAFDQLDEFYPDYVPEFREMMRLNEIELPRNVTQGISTSALESMIQMTRRMERPLTSALGPNWKDILTREKIAELYARM